MKHFKLFVPAAIALLLFASCNKSYTCVCVNPNNIEGNGSLQAVKASSPSNAETKCKDIASFCYLQ